MSATVQGSTLLDGLKKKMRQTKEEMEKYKDECEEYQKRLQLESRRREEVRIRELSLGVGLISRIGGSGASSWGV